MSDSEKVVVTKESNWAEFEEFMKGNAEAYAAAEKAGRYDLSKRGMDTTPTAQDTLPPTPQPNFELNPEANIATFATPQPPVSNEQNWKQLYGQSENEKYELRKSVEQANSELQATINELKTLRASFNTGAQDYTPPIQANYSPQPTFAAPQPAPQVQVAAQQPQVMFDKDRPKDDFVSIADMERIMSTMVAPAVVQTWQEAQRIAYTQQLVSKKLSVGITPEIEGRLHKEFAWLRNLADDERKLAAMQDLVSRTVQRKVALPPTAQSPAQAATEAAARRIMVAGPNGAVPASEPDEILTPEQTFQKALTEALTKPWGKERKEALDAVWKKAGVTRANDFGKGTVSP